MKTDGEVLNAALYAIYNEYGIFVSKFSQEDAMEKYINYAFIFQFCSPIKESKSRVAEQ